MRTAEIELAAALILGEARTRRRQRQQHGVAQVRAGRGIGEHVRQEQALRLFQAKLVALHARRLYGKRGIARQQARERRRGASAKLVGPQELRAPGGELVVDRPGLFGLHAANYGAAGSWR